MNHRAPANRRLFLPIRLCLLVLTVAVFAGGAVFLSACRTPGQAPDSSSATATETETVTTEMSGVTEPGSSETETEPESAAGEETAHLHAYGDWAILQAPTCTGAGERTHTCTVCGHVETESVPATGHTSVEDAAVPGFVAVVAGLCWRSLRRFRQPGISPRLYPENCPPVPRRG